MQTAKWNMHIISQFKTDQINEQTETVLFLPKRNFHFIFCVCLQTANTMKDHKHSAFVWSERIRSSGVDENWKIVWLLFIIMQSFYGKCNQEFSMFEIVFRYIFRKIKNEKTLLLVALLCCPETTCHANRMGRKRKKNYLLPYYKSMSTESIFHSGKKPF